MLGTQEYQVISEPGRRGENTIGTILRTRLGERNVPRTIFGR